jgi:beta-glucosidase
VALQPGETRQVSVDLPVNQLAFINANSDLVLEAGAIDVMVGSSSEDIRLRGEFEITESLELPLAERVFDCPVTIQ